MLQPMEKRTGDLFAINQFKFFTKMTEKQIFPETVGSAVKVQNPLDANSETNDTTLNEVLNDLADAIGSGGGGDGDSIPANTPVTDIDFGSIPKGTDISGMDIATLINNATHAEYAPVFADATASIAAKIGTIVEVGTIVPSLSESNFNIGGTAAKATAGSYVANGGAASNTITCNVQGVGEAKTDFGNVVYTLSRAYAAGSDVVKSTKGNPTNKTAANATTLLSKASANANIDATDKTIKAITKKATCTIAFVDAFYANTAAIGTMTKRLTDAAVLEYTFPAETPEAHHAISIPESYRITKIELKNPVSGNFENYELNKFVATSENRTIADGSTKEYLKYTRNDGESDSNTFKFYITRG